MADDHYEADLETVTLTDVTIPPSVLNLVPESIAREHLVFPLCKDDGRLRLAITDVANLEAVAKLKFILQMDIQQVLAPSDQMIDAINRHYNGPPDEANSSMQTIRADLDQVLRKDDVADDP